MLREIVPPKPVKTFLYQCDDHFHIEYLKDMLREEKVYGILAIDANDAGIGILSGRVVRGRERDDLGHLREDEEGRAERPKI